MSTIPKKLLCTLLLVLFVTLFAHSAIAQQLSLKLQNAIGHWQVMNNDGTLGGQVETYLVNGKLFGKVTKLKPSRKPDDICDLCSGDLKNKPMLGMVIMRDMQPEGDDWADGFILDPDNGKEYHSKLWAIDKDHLSMRGYIGISLFGRTSNWVRIP
jgi:uncharacterized protein (DUF2147 family)